MNNQLSAYNFPDVIGHFNITADDFDVSPFGSGHINDTFLLKNKEGSLPNYLLQKINKFVFKDVGILMANMERVLFHLKQKIAKAGGDPEREVLTLVECKDGGYFAIDAQGNYWRMTLFLEDTRSYDLVTTENQAYQGGVAFGRFQQLLADLDPVTISDVIPDFLNIEKRLRDFNGAVADNKAGRLQNVLPEVEFLKSRAVAMNDILIWGKAGILPMRITHNDTKFNNILLDKNNNIQCVIDLDTVMPGYVAYDFGDAIRSIINTAQEDEADLDAIQINVPLYTQFTKGYLSETESFLTETELKSLVVGVLLLPYMQALRFLTDYLEGDVYYKTEFAEHNLQRTRAQMQLFKLLEQNREKLSDIVNSEWLQLKANAQVAAADAR